MQKKNANRYVASLNKKKTSKLFVQNEINAANSSRNAIVATILIYLLSVEGVTVYVLIMMS